MAWIPQRNRKNISAMESDRIPLSSAIFFGTENNSESRLGTGKHVTMVAKGLYRDLVSIGLWECLLRGHKGFWEGSESARFTWIFSG